MATVVDVALQQTFVDHDLHQFQGRGIVDLALLVELLVDVAYSRRAALPKHLKDLQFGFGRLGPFVILRVIFFHAAISRKNFVRKNS